ncbi:MAG: hypothetical protein QW733_06000 [Desulfurococcaceae archaeon]
MAFEELVNAVVDIAKAIIQAIPAVLLAIIVILVGYLIGKVFGAVVKLVYHRVVWRFLKPTAIGRKLEEAKVDLGAVLGGIVTAVITALAILLAINMLGFLGPAVEFIAMFIRLIIGILGGVVVLVLGIPLAMLAAEYIAKLIGWSLGERDGLIPILTTIIGVLLLLFVFGLAIAVMFGATELLTILTASLPAAFMAAVIIIVGYIVADLVAKVVRLFLEKISKPLEATDIGAALKGAGVDIVSLIAGLVKAAIIVIAITVGLGMIGAAGVAADVLGVVTYYLPRILASIALLTLGLALVLVLARYIGKIFRTVAKDKYVAIGDLFENLIAIGLIAVFITIALNILGLYGDFVYSLVIGALIIAVGIVIVDAITSVLRLVHPAFEKFTPLIGAVFVFVFAYVGVSAILSQLPEAMTVLRTISWGVAIAFALMIIPVVFYLVRVAWREAASTA